MANPWVKFYTSDWRSDPALRMCSLAARGLWVELICLMHEASPYGHLLVNGLSPTDAQLGVLVGASPDEIAAMLGELESAGVFSRTRAGVIYSRKLTRMAKKAATARNNGRKGGNPTLCKDDGNLPPDNPSDKGGLKTQKPEARSQKERVSNDTLGQKAEGFDQFWAIWPNKTAKQKAMTAWKRLSMPDRRAAYAAVRDGWFDQWRRRHPEANPIHPASFINGRRWQDEPHDPALTVIPGGRHDRQTERQRTSQAVDEYIRRVGEGTLDRGPDPSNPFSR